MELTTATGGVSINTIQVDSRETDKVIKNAREHFKSLEVTFLPIGDFVSGEVCIERKKLDDFVGSINSKRMYNQAANMEKNYKHNYIIIIGRLSQLENSRFFDFSKRRFRREVAYLMANYNVKVLVVDDDKSFYEQIYQIFKQHGEKSEGKKNGIKRIAPRTGDVYIDMICVVDKIGPKKAEEILKIYKVYELFDASVKDLMAIKGIGKTQATRIKEVYHR